MGTTSATRWIPRFGPAPGGYTEKVLSNFRPPKLDRRVPPEYLTLASQRGLLLKLGERVHMEAMLEEGRIRVSPASRYRDRR